MLWGLAFAGMTLTAAAPVRGRSPTSPGLPSPPQNVERLATALDNLCPICLDGWEEVSYMVSCLQQFCYTCILWWTERKPKCPLCKRRVTSILHSVWVDNSFEEHVFRPSVESSVIFHQAGGASVRPAPHRCHRPAAPRPSAAGLVPGDPVGSFHPYIWVSLLHVSYGPCCPGCAGS